MKRILCLFPLLLSLLVLHVSAQELTVPRVSPKAAVSYTIGLTKVTVTYGAPAVKGRVIWGSLVPYNEVWRAGANEATTVEFSTDVNIEGQMLKAGKYALFFIPGEKEWTVILNRKWDQWGAYDYDETEDAVRFTVEPKMNEAMQERLTYSLHDMKPDMGYIKLGWEKMRLYLRFKVDLMEQVASNMQQALDTTAEDKQWVIYAQGAQFMIDADGNMDQALEWARQSTERHGTCWNWYVRGLIEAKKGDMEAALASGTKSLALGTSYENDAYFKEHEKEIRTSLRTWKANSSGAALEDLMMSLDTVPEGKKWMIYAQGAQMLLDSDGNLDQALDWARQSTSRYNCCWNWYIRGQVEAKRGDMVAAVASGTKSVSLGMADDTDVYYKEHQDEITAAIQAWAAKMN